MKSDKIKEIVKKGYSEMSKKGCCGSGHGCDSGKNNVDISKSIGYSDEEIVSFDEANLGLGCGNPVAMAAIREGDVVLDLGSGAGFDAFIARGKVGEKGKVIGVDMTEEMIEKARGIAEKNGYDNVEFRLGDIEDLPVESNSVDVVISNCVINLAPNKKKVFSEAYRALKKGGKMFVSDIVLLSELSEEKKSDEKLLCGCVGGAMMRDDYIAVAKSAGFDVEILGEDKEISKEQYKGVDLESLKLKLTKSEKVVSSKCGCCCNG
jgi:ArsR family transcriptional regulator